VEGGVTIKPAAQADGTGGRGFPQFNDGGRGVWGVDSISGKALDGTG
jgi:hypothetical protein